DTGIGIHLPSIDEWEVPIDCHACHGTYAVSFRHLRTGNVLRCPFCTATYIVTTTMHGNVSRALEAFHRRWRDDFEALSERRRRAKRVRGSKTRRPRGLHRAAQEHQPLGQAAGRAAQAGLDIRLTRRPKMGATVEWRRASRPPSPPPDMLRRTGHCLDIRMNCPRPTGP